MMMALSLAFVINLLRDLSHYGNGPGVFRASSFWPHAKALYLI
nr:hypothetical protein [Phytobacter sp.]